MLRGGHTRKTPPAAPRRPTPLPDAKLQAAPKTSDQLQLLLRRPGGDLRARFVHEHVDLAAHTEPAREADPGLDREPHARHERALARGLEVVDVRARAVEVAIDRVAGAVHEVLGVTGGADHGPSRVIDLRTGEDPS